MSGIDRYTSYLQAAFDLDASEAEKRVQKMHEPLGKSIRINTSKGDVKSFLERHTNLGWHFTQTDIPEVFYVDRDDTSIALGATEEHQSGQFYIQEVAASHPPHVLRTVTGDGGRVTERSETSEIQEPATRNPQHETRNTKPAPRTPQLILDMCSSPGGKTTQLAQYFPDSLIIANEADKGRLPQLYENIERMGHANICVTNYDGRYYKHFPERFDAILLDAPCSGEGCAFKTKEALKNWHIKNIRRIAKLQYQLFLTAYSALKPGGILVYSTCTLNQEENEGVIDKALKKINEGDSVNCNLKTINSFRLWPHETGTGGFFYAAFQKPEALSNWSELVTEAIPAKNNISYLSSSSDGSSHEYAFKKDRFQCTHDVRELMETMYFTKIGLHV